jgi:hypothetical protein
VTKLKKYSQLTDAKLTLSPQLRRRASSFREPPLPQQEQQKPEQQQQPEQQPPVDLGDTEAQLREIVDMARTAKREE